MSRTKEASDAYFMHIALDEAKKGGYDTWPNPNVGCVVVKNGKILSQSHHYQAGKPHAEVLALDNLSSSVVRNSVVYVTLEPCSHINKRTPPCANYLINKGVRRLVVAMRDPNPNVNGSGIQLLRRAGVHVTTGILKKEAEQINRPYIFTLKNNIPYVALKSAMSLDGKVALSTGESQWITNKRSRTFVHKLRSAYDAVITSSSTVVKDNPYLNVRYVKGKQPLRVVVDRFLKTSSHSHVYQDSLSLVFCSEEANRLHLKSIQKSNIQVISLPVDNFSLKYILEILYQRGIKTALVEAGGTFMSAFVNERLFQRIYYFYSPLLIGSEGISSVGELQTSSLSKAIKFKHVSFQTFDDNFLIQADL